MKFKCLNPDCKRDFSYQEDAYDSISQQKIEDMLNGKTPSSDPEEMAEILQCPECENEEIAVRKR